MPKKSKPSKELFYVLASGREDQGNDTAYIYPGIDERGLPMGASKASCIDWIEAYATCYPSFSLIQYRPPMSACVIVFNVLA